MKTETIMIIERVMVIIATFNNISVISWPVRFISDGSRRKSPTCRKSL